MGASYPWVSCSLALSESVLKDPDPLDETLIAQQTRQLRKHYEDQLKPIPLSQLTRATDSFGICAPHVAAGTATPFLILTFFLGLGGFWFRRKAQVAKLDEHEHRENARRANRVPTQGISEDESLPLRNTSANPAVRRTSHAGLEVVEPRRTTMGMEAVPARRTSHAGLDAVGPTRRPSYAGGDIGIDVDVPLEFGGKSHEDEEEDESIMKFIQDESDQRAANEAEMVVVASQVGGYYCPSDFRDKPVIYVDPASRAARDDYEGKTPFNEPEKPFASLDGAVRYAQQRVIRDTPGIQIRLAPGTYKTSIIVPDRVAIINHRMPAVSSRDSEEEGLTKHLKWITDQAHNAPDRVTLLAAPDADHAAKFVTGTIQGIYGCHIMGQEGRAQAGIVAKNCQRLTIRACVIDGFSRGGIRLDSCGNDVPGQGTHVLATELVNNAAGFGGGICASKSVLTVIECLIHANKAHKGGGICVEESRGLTTILRTRISKNIAAAKEPKQTPVDSSPEVWKSEDGVGGGLHAFSSKIRISESEFVDNRATAAGGAVMILGGKAAFQGNDEVDVRIHRNTAPVGSALCIVGTHGLSAVAKYVGADIQQNTSSIGGAIAVIGLASVQFDDGKVAYNEAPGKQAIGGAFSIMLGAELVLKDMEIKENSCGGPGGAIGAINATIRIGEGCELRNNTSQDSGGALYFITRPDSELEDLISHHGFKTPFILAVKDCLITNNKGDGLGGGVFVGNLLPHATFPVGMRLEGTARIRNNRTRHPNETGDDIWVVWAGETVATSVNRPPGKVLLK